MSLVGSRRIFLKAAVPTVSVGLAAMLKEQIAASTDSYVLLRSTVTHTACSGDIAALQAPGKSNTWALLPIFGWPAPASSSRAKAPSRSSIRRRCRLH